MKNNTQHTIAPYEPKTWKGYTITQLEHRQAINAVKCDLIKEQMSLAYSQAMNSFGGESGKLGPQFNKVLSYLSYGVQICKYARTVYSIFKGK